MKGHVWMIRRFGVVRWWRYEQARRSGVEIDYEEVFAGMDILDEIEKAEQAYKDCPRWRLFKRKRLCDHWLMCCGILQTFEQTRIAVQRDQTERA